MKRGSKLRSAGDVSSFLARIIRETYKGSLNPKTAGTLGYLCNCLKSCLETADLAQVVEAWGRLPEAVKAGILAMVSASK